jgi:hypothetical protein
MRGSKRIRAVLVAALAATAAGAEASGGRGAEKHATISAYEGTRTCAACHPQQVKDVATSLHYQQQGAAPFLANAQQAKSAGMMVSY